MVEVTKKVTYKGLLNELGSILNKKFDSCNDMFMYVDEYCVYEQQSSRVPSFIIYCEDLELVTNIAKEIKKENNYFKNNLLEIMYSYVDGSNKDIENSFRYRNDDLGIIAFIDDPKYRLEVIMNNTIYQSLIVNSEGKRTLRDILVDLQYDVPFYIDINDLSNYLDGFISYSGDYDLTGDIKLYTSIGYNGDFYQDIVCDFYYNCFRNEAEYNAFNCNLYLTYDKVATESENIEV